MDDVLTSYTAITAMLAFGAAAAVAALVAVPYLIIHWRRTGTFGWGSTMLLFGTVVYAFALAGYTMLPLPDDWSPYCARPRNNNMMPFGFITDVEAALAGGRVGLRTVVSQLALNIALFVPLGMFVQRLVTRRWWLTLPIGFAVSALIEVTQLTAVFGLFPCQWRIFDVDDLIMNTLGTGVGILLAPLLKFLPGQPSTSRAERLRHRPHARWRSLAAVLIDLLIIGAVPSIVATIATVSTRLLTGSMIEGEASGELALFTSLGVLVLVQTVLMLVRGTSIGEWTTWTHVRRRDGAPAEFWRRLVRWLTSILPAALFVASGEIGEFFDPENPTVPTLLLSVLTLIISLGAAPVSIVWLIVLLTKRRTLTDIAAGTLQVDARPPLPQPPLPTSRSPHDDTSAEATPVAHRPRSEQ